MKCGFREIAQKYLNFLASTTSTPEELLEFKIEKEKFDRAVCSHEKTTQPDKEHDEQPVN